MAQLLKQVQTTLVRALLRTKLRRRVPRHWPTLTSNDSPHPLSWQIATVLVYTRLTHVSVVVLLLSTRILVCLGHIAMGRKCWPLAWLWGKKLRWPAAFLNIYRCSWLVGRALHGIPQALPRWSKNDPTLLTSPVPVAVTTLDTLTT